MSRSKRHGIDQIVFDWARSNMLGTDGYGPVAASVGPDDLQ